LRNVGSRSGRHKPGEAGGVPLGSAFFMVLWSLVPFWPLALSEAFAMRFAASGCGVNLVYKHPGSRGRLITRAGCVLIPPRFCSTLMAGA
jgi:hypothetical protein